MESRLPQLWVRLLYLFLWDRLFHLTFDGWFAVSFQFQLLAETVDVRRSSCGDQLEEPKCPMNILSSKCSLPVGRVGLRVGVDGPGQEVPRPTPASPQPVQAPLLQDTLRQGDNSCNVQTSYLGQKTFLFGNFCE